MSAVVCDLCGEEKSLDDVLVRRWTPENAAITLGFKRSDILCLTCAGASRGTGQEDPSDG